MGLKSRATGIVIGSLFVLAVTVTSARADSVHSLWFLQDVEKDRFGLLSHIDFGELRDTSDLRREHLDSGRQLGSFISDSASTSGSVSTSTGVSTFSFADSNQGREFLGGATIEKTSQVASVSYSRQASVTPNPEPATMLLLGTGLAAVGAYARRKFHP